jgi:ubiquinone/menaquinone biosynthesis C-methylase UbiE
MFENAEQISCGIVGDGRDSTIDLEGCEMESDCWSDWLLRGRHGGDATYEPIMREEVAQIRNRVLEGARLSSGMTLLDVGAGEGLIAFAALHRTTQPFSVILADISGPLLNHAERIATSLGVRDHCSFVRTTAETLEGITDESVDVLTSRAVLAYVQDKASAASNFYRVLRPGGRLSLGEPVAQDAALQLTALTSVLRSEPVNSNTPYLRVLQRCRALQLPSNLADVRTHPFTNYTERDLLQLFRKAGFVNLHMELHVDVKAGAAMPWSTFLAISPRPGAPCLRDIFEQHLTRAEAGILERRMRADVEGGKLVSQNTTVYLTAEKPS